MNCGPTLHPWHSLVILVGLLYLNTVWITTPCPRSFDREHGALRRVRLSVLLLAASDEGIQTRGRGATGSNTVLRLEKLRQLCGLKNALVKVVGLGTQVGSEGL